MPISITMREKEGPVEDNKVDCGRNFLGEKSKMIQKVGLRIELGRIWVEILLSSSLEVLE